MFFTNIFTMFNHKCEHNQLPINIDLGYCPDCGKLIKNEWYIVRCSCCDKKMKAIIRKNKIVPQYKFCSNCGGHDYIIEKIDKIDFININYAVLRKTETEEIKNCMTTRCWQEKIYEQPKLIGLYR